MNLKLLRFQQLIKSILTSFALLFFFILLTPQGYAASTTPSVVLNPEQTTYDLRKYTEIYVDPTNQLTVQQVSSPSVSKNFTPLTVLKRQVYDARSWVRFHIDNPTDQVMHLFLTKKEPVRIKAWTLYTQNQQGQLTEWPDDVDSSFQVFLFLIILSSSQELALWQL